MEYLFAKTDQIFQLVAGHSPVWIYLFVLLSMTIENLFPPYPGDTAIFICGVYAAGGHASWTVIYIISVIGTLISVMILHYIGKSKGRDIFMHKRVRWLGVSKLEKIEKWFHRWGEKLLLLSRFMTGVRALLALLAGVGRVSSTKMLLYSLISACAWNFLVLYLALVLRRDWDKFDKILSTYNWILFTVITIIAVLLLLKIYYSRRRNRTA